MFTDGRTDGQTTDGRQAHRYISRAFRSGDKNEVEEIYVFSSHVPQASHIFTFSIHACHVFSPAVVTKHYKIEKSNTKLTTYTPVTPRQPTRLKNAVEINRSE